MKRIVSTPFSLVFQKEKSWFGWIGIYIIHDSIGFIKYSYFAHLDFTLFLLPNSAFADLCHFNYSGSDIFNQYMQNKRIKDMILVH